MTEDVDVGTVGSAAVVDKCTTSSNLEAIINSSDNLPMTVTREAPIRNHLRTRSLLRLSNPTTTHSFQTTSPTHLSNNSSPNPSLSTPQTSSRQIQHSNSHLPPHSSPNSKTTSRLRDHISTRLSSPCYNNRNRNNSNPNLRTRTRTRTKTRIRARRTRSQRLRPSWIC